jgi:hypothetical protein
MIRKRNNNNQGLGGGRPRQYGLRVQRSVSMEQNIMADFESLAYDEHKSFSKKLEEIMVAELDRKKETGQQPNAIGLTYHHQNSKLGQKNSVQTLISEFGTVGEAYQTLKDEGVSYEECPDVERCFLNGVQGVKQYRPNAPHNNNKVLNN